MKEREAAVAGSFYFSDAEILREQVRQFFEDCRKPMVNEKIKALIVPHAGLVYSGVVAASAYKVFSDQLKRRMLSTEKIAVFGPAHTLAFKGMALDGNNCWNTPFGKISIAKPKSKLKDTAELSEAHLQEHSIEVQMPFLQEVFSTQKKKFQLIPIVVGDIDFESVSENMRLLMEKENAFIIVSSDLSHYHPYELALKIDGESNKGILRLDQEFLKDSLEACGKASVIALSMLAKKLGWKPRILDYKNSGDTAGDKKQVVGYSSIAFC